MKPTTENQSKIDRVIRELGLLYDFNRHIQKISLLPVKAQQQKTDQRPLLLLAEDEDDLRTVLIFELSGKYRVIATENVEEALKTTVDVIPDIIVSDIMMPLMDGTQLSEKIKNNRLTSHIPFIMLTAKNTVQDQIDALENGADYCLTKPVHIKLLVTIIETLLRSRSQLKEKIGLEISLDGLATTTQKANEAFIQKAVNSVSKNLSRVDFSCDDFARDLGMSLRNFQRKLKVLTGLSPSRFMSKVRMRHAAKLITHTDLTITEIALEVASEHPSNFASAFKNEYSLSPSDFRMKSRSNASHDDSY